MCADLGLAPARYGWGAVLYRIPDGTQFTLFTPDIDYMNQLSEAQSAGVPFHFGDLELGRFQHLGGGWPIGWERPRGRIPAGIARLLFSVEFALLGFVALRAAGITLFPGLKPPDRVAAVALGATVLAGLLFLVFPLGERPSGLVGAAADWDQEAVRRRLWALLGAVIAVGGLGGLAVTRVLAPSDRQVLAGSAIGALVAAVGGMARVIGHRRTLGQEAVALLRRACRNPAALLTDRELARLEVLLTASWVPGSRTSWMTARTARAFTSELAKPEQARSSYLAPCLNRTLSWVENGSGLVGTFHTGVGLATNLSSLPDQYPSIRLAIRMFTRLSRWRPRYYKRSASARYAGLPESGSTGNAVADHYADGTYRWWHLSVPSPELVQAVADGWLSGPARVLDVGCGIGTEAAHLHALGWQAAGIDLSRVALRAAAACNPGPAYLQADLLRAPLRSSSVDACLDRGCFQYLAASDRAGYAAEISRVLRPGGKLLLRAPLRAAGVRNDITEQVIRTTFTGWQIEHMERTAIPSDTRTFEVLLVHLVRL